jgi:chromosome partitioning protein
MPTNQDLTSAEVRLLMACDQREQRLRDALEPIRDLYDLILIDCPPALNMLTVNALVAADSVLIPMQCEYYALEGLSALVATIEQIGAPPTRGSRSKASCAPCSIRVTIWRPKSVRS